MGRKPKDRDHDDDFTIETEPDPDSIPAVYDEKTAQANSEFKDFSFRISSENMIMLCAMVKYCQMLDYVSNADDNEKISMDGIVNSIIALHMAREFKVLAKKHGFDTVNQFTSRLIGCDDGAAVYDEIQKQEFLSLCATRNVILSHTPVESKQKTINFQ